jgi:predicted component of type VI protein secretion system|nr:MAG TPA: InsA C-terminal domain [Caudoviricetes sp.]
MTSINDVADLPKRLEDWANGKGYRGAFGIDAERKMVEDLRKLLLLTVQQAKALGDSQERAHALEQRLPTSQTDDLEPEPPLDDPLEEAARLDRKARRDAKLARAALQQEVLAAYSRGVSKSVLSSVSGMTRQTVDKVLGQWKRKPPKIDAGEETPLTLI